MRGEAGVEFRARTQARADAVSRAFNVTAKPGDNYTLYSVDFPTGLDGQALVIIASSEGFGAGPVYLADMAIVEEINLDSAGPAIPVQPGQPLTITDVPAVDCRALRGLRRRGWAAQQLQLEHG